MISQEPELRPAAFCTYLLRTLDAAEGQTRRRKRDQTPDKIGLAIRRALLEQAIRDDPPAVELEAWLMARVLESSQPGAVRAMATIILDELRFADAQPDFKAWLLAGAPSADADDAPHPKSDAEVMGGDRAGKQPIDFEDHYCPICSSEHVRDG